MSCAERHLSFLWFLRPDARSSAITRARSSSKLIQGSPTPARKFKLRRRPMLFVCRENGGAPVLSISQKPRGMFTCPVRVVFDHGLCLPGELDHTAAFSRSRAPELGTPARFLRGWDALNHVSLLTSFEYICYA